MRALEIALGLVVMAMGIIMLPQMPYAWFQIGAGIFCVYMGARGLEQAAASKPEANHE